LINDINELDRNENYIFMCNHKSYFDIYILFVVLKNFDFILLVKNELFKIPLFSWALKKLGYIAIDRSNKGKAVKSFLEVLRAIKGGRSVAIFPEGTRSYDGKLLPLKRGAFTIAERTNVKIVPIKICDTHLVNRRGNFLITPFKRVDVAIFPPIETSNKSIDELIKLVTTCLS
jgi:1-acyl-sn-glycerol-3-phosphate acyltransferase